MRKDLIATVSGNSGQSMVNVSSIRASLKFAREFGSTMDKLTVWHESNHIEPLAEYKKNFNGKWIKIN